MDSKLQEWEKLCRLEKIKLLRNREKEKALDTESESKREKAARIKGNWKFRENIEPDVTPQKSPIKNLLLMPTTLQETPPVHKKEIFSPARNPET